MLNYLWGFMVVAGIAYGVITGNVADTGNGALEAAGDAINLCITMAGVMGVWCGIMEIARKSGLIDSITSKLQPFIRWMFPDIPSNHAAVGYISTNFIANILGLGWAATPAGLKAMEELAKLEAERRENIQDIKKQNRNRIFAMPRDVASNEMCTFLIINISSLQLIPVNVIAYRSQYGSVNPTAIVGPGIVATAVSTGVAVVFCKVMDRKRRA